MERDIIDIAKSDFKESDKLISKSPLMPEKFIFKNSKPEKKYEPESTAKLKNKLSKKEKVKEWIKVRDNQIFLGIMLFAIVVRLYYFWITKSQALWWDESDYLAYAKTLAGMGTSWVITSQHNSLFPYMVALFFKIGISEMIIKFILEIIPSIILVFLTYKICEGIYKDKKMALISTFVMAVFWNILFNSTRFHLEAPALMFAFLAIYSFFIGYEKRQKIFLKINPNWAILLAVIFTIISYSIRRNYAFFGIFFLIYMLFTKKISVLIKDKYNWMALIVAAILLIITENFIFISSAAGVASEYYHPEDAINWTHINFLSLFFQGQTLISSIFFWLTILGLIVTVLKLAIVLDNLRKNNNLEIKFDFFLVLSLIITLAYFIFFQRGSSIGEPRWYFPMLLAALIFTARGAIFISSQIKKHDKKMAVLVLILLVLIGGYFQLQHADQIIKAKVPSYSGIRAAGMKVNSISNIEDIVITSSVPQAAYYSERPTIHFGDMAELHSENEFNKTLEYLEKNKNVRFILISFSEPHNPTWVRNEGEEYSRDQNGQVIRLKWEVPFMDTFVNFQTGEQQILQEKTYGKITFKLVSIEQDVFIYEIVRIA